MIRSLSIQGFRGFSKESLEIAPRSIIRGENGSGKTHILEAIHIVSWGTFHSKSRTNEGSYSISIRYKTDHGEKSYSLEKVDRQTFFRVAGAKATRKKYIDSLPYRTVFISPFDMNLFYFAPSMRRDFLDEILERAFSQFSQTKKEYESTMRQRNALLKRIREGLSKRSDLDYWDATFSEKAMLYSLYREKWCRWIEDQIDSMRAYLTQYDLTFSYESSYFHEIDRKAFIERYLKENRERDILTGHTHIGPHLDDFVFLISQDSIQYEAHLYLSRGEVKMLLVGLKQLEILFLRKVLDLPIILLFDDLFAELDMRHAERVIEHFEVDQVILTTQREIPEEKKWEDFSCINLSPG